jgi:hypothetical protein
MQMGLTLELKVGDKIEITLKLEKAGDVTVTAEVRQGRPVRMENPEPADVRRPDRILDGSVTGPPGGPYRP